MKYLVPYALARIMRFSNLIFFRIPSFIHPIHVCVNIYLIPLKGVRNVKKSDLNPIYIFISPPSMKELERRLRGRGTEEEESIQKRLCNAKAEMDYGYETGNFDKILVNSDLDATFEELVNSFKEWYPALTEVAPDDEPEKSCNAKCVVS